MVATSSRRVFVGGLAGAVLAPVISRRAWAGLGIDLGPSQHFSFAGLQAEAERLAAQPFSRTASPAILAQIDYDYYQRIRYRRDRTLFLGPYPIQFHHLGKYARDAVRISVIAPDGQARDVIYRDDLFEVPAGHPALRLARGAGFAGFRVMAPDLNTDWFSVVGASYFRSSGPFDQYGLSARAVAIDTATQKTEEFPRFVQCWLGPPRHPTQPLEFYGLLDGPSLTGALRAAISRSTDRRGAHQVVNDIEIHFFVRQDILRVGLAPFSSMFWYGEAPHRQPSDWRPEIHDSDGLAIWTGAGERMWRPLLNPPQVMTNSFIDTNVKGFGLAQRDRSFDHYLDDGAFYHRRPSVWVEPREDWGEGAVQLVEMPTGEETWDNVVAYWAPKAPWKAGESKVYRYRLTWLDEIPYPENLARVIGTWSGLGGPPGLSYRERDPETQKFVIDFEGKNLAGLGRDDGVALIVTASRGTIAGVASYPVVSQEQRWRGLFDLTAAGREPIDLRAYLRKGDSTLSETWVYQNFTQAYL